MGFDIIDCLIFILSIAFLYLLIRWLCIVFCDKNSCATYKNDWRSGSTNRENTNQAGDVWTISGRANTRERPVTSEPGTRWPTHDNHIAVDSFVIPESFQPYKIDKIPPPPYCEVDLPTYEQATVNPKDTTVTPSIHVTPGSSRVVN